MSAPDLSAVSSAVDFANVVAAVVAIGAVLMAPKVAAWGTRKVLAMVSDGPMEYDPDGFNQDMPPDDWEAQLDAHLYGANGDSDPRIAKRDEYDDVPF